LHHLRVPFGTHKVVEDLLDLFKRQVEAGAGVGIFFPYGTSTADLLRASG
jgi:hypothetical protein